MENQKKPNFFYAISLGLQLGFTVVVPLIIFLLLGIFLDKKLSTSPCFTISLTILSLVFVFFEVKSYLLPLLEKKK